MGRGANNMAKAANTGGFGSPVIEGISIVQPDLPPDVGSDAHRRRLEQYARARTNRSDVHVSFSGSCMMCGHDYDSHLLPGKSCQEDGCNPQQDGNPCQNYIPNGKSFTDMKGSITLQSDIPPDQTAVERELCLNGLLSHETCHELYTDPEAAHKFFKELEKKQKNKQEITAQQLQHMWNVLEDGMIEHRERELKPGSFKYISALNKIHPRIGAEAKEVENEYVVRAPEGYIPRDADGKKLEVKTAQEIIDSDPNLTPDQKKILLDNVDPNEKFIFVPKGTKISPWGKYPLDERQQIQLALHARALPEFEEGEMTKRVKNAFDECEEHVVAGISGNTSDCIARAYTIHAILKKHDLLDDDLTDEEREQAKRMAQEMGQVGPTAPQQGDPGEGQGDDNGQSGQGAANGIPQPQKGQEAMGDELSDQISNGGGGNEQSSGGEEDDADGEGGNSKDKDDGEEEQQNGQGEDDGDADDEQQGKQNSGQGDEQGEEGESESGNGKQQDGEKGKQQQQNNQRTAQQGGTEEAGGFDPSRPLPQESIAKNEAQAKGSVSGEQLDEMKKKAKNELDSDKAQQTATDQRKIRSNRLEADDYKFTDSSKAFSQREMSSRSKGEALPNEQGELAQMGNQLATRLKRLKDETRAPERFRRRGRLDPRRYGPALAGNPKVYYKKGVNLDLDMEIDVSIDRSGSVTGVDTENQYRMAKMFAKASQSTKIPMAIYGWDGGGFMGGGTAHYAYKERHSDDTRGIDAIFQSGGGGTPTDAGVMFSRRRLANSKASQKIMVVITDGGANNPESAAEQVRAAEAEGVKVIGMAFQCENEAATMDKQFGRGKWISINDYNEAPRLLGSLIERIAQQSALKKRR